MRRFTIALVTAVSTIGLTQMASAADLPRKAPPAYIPPAPPPITWTGCYIGSNIGWAFGRAKADFNFGEVSTNGSGFAGGGQIGCDYQFAGTGWVIGFRNMFDGTSNSRSRTINGFGGPFDGGEVHFKNQWFDTLTGRLGYAAAPTWLLYFQGGAAWTRTETDLTVFSAPFIGAQFEGTSKTRTGWTIGGGVEWRFAPQFSAFLEGNWMDFGSNDRTIFNSGNFFDSRCVGGCTFSTKATAATVLVGVNYRWNWGKAPYAAY